MMQVLQWAQGVFSTQELMVLVAFAMVISMIVYIMTSPDYYSKRDEIRSKYKKRLRRHVRIELQNMVKKASHKAREIGKDLEVKCTGICGLDPIGMQVDNYAKTLRLVVKDYLMDDVLIALYENGFHDKTGDMLDMYLSGRSATLFGDVVERMERECDGYPDILSHPDQRYSQEEAKELYTGIVRFYIECHEKEGVEVEALKKSYSVKGRVKALVHHIKEAV